MALGHSVEDENNLSYEELVELVEDMDDSEPSTNQEMMTNTITVECQKLNGKPFIGTVNFSEAKNKIFKDGLGLDVGLLDVVKISFSKYEWLNESYESFKVKCKNVLL